MGKRFAELAFTPLVQAQQEAHGSRLQYARMQQTSGADETLGANEREYLAGRDGFYMASVSETGWPYMQYRGGPKGFLHVLDERTLAFADLRGNRQYISVGNLEHDDRVCLFLMDYARQRRLKILGRVEVVEGTDRATKLIEQLHIPEQGSHPERALLIHVEGFDWNCPQHITPRFTVEEVGQIQQDVLSLSLADQLTLKTVRRLP